MNEPIISLENANARNEALRFRRPVNFTLNPGEQIAVIGANGSGKSILTSILTGTLPLRDGKLTYRFPSGATTAYGNIAHIAFRDAYGTADGSYYYQQRWNASERDDVPKVREVLEKIPGEHSLRQELFGILGIESMLEKELILLSSGELRKFQIAKTLLTAPEVLVVETPFIGLDATARRLLNELLERIIRRTGLQIVLVISHPKDLPAFITHVYTMEGRTCGAKQTREEFLRTETLTAGSRAIAESPARLVLPSSSSAPLACDEVVRMRNLTLRYGSRTLIEGLDWTVRNGEKWMLSGPNGSGKSTLLSFISADNPQAYAHDITLFGRKRGSGESIWDIKRHIGYVSPEMHRAYVKDMPAVDIVASGFFDSVGLYRKADDAQRAVCEAWMESFGIAELRDRSFIRLSSGEQRLLLLARAFVKDPDLLILDEPLHGLDCFNKERARQIIDAFCQREGKTLIYVTHYAEELPSCVTQKLEL